MLTLNEIRNVNFRKSNFGGYRAEDVEAFIDEVQLSYDALLRENAELVKKLEVLAARLAEYQQEEDSIRNALMNAQKVGDASLRDAKHKAEIILKDATIKAERIVANAQTEIHRERDIIDRMQKDIADFKARLLKAYKDHLTLINNLPTGEILTPETREMSDSVVMLDRKAAAPFAQSEPAPAAEAAPSARPAQRPRPAMPQMPNMTAARPVQAEIKVDEPDFSEVAPVAPAVEKPVQRKDGFTVNIGDENEMPKPGGIASGRQPRFTAFDPNVDNSTGAAAQEESENSPANLFRRRGQ